MKRFLIQGAWGLLIVALTVAGYARWSNPADDVPAYNSKPPAKGRKLPPVLSGSQLTGDNFRYPWQIKVYKEAATIQPVLFQLPCYCHCDRAMGHNSLHSCFEGTHGAECSTCAKEEDYAAANSRGHRTQGIRVDRLAVGCIGRDPFQGQNDRRITGHANVPSSK